MATDDPRPLTRRELSEFLPSQRAVKAFEKLFDLIPSDLIQLLAAVDEASNDAQTALSLSQQALKRRTVECDYIDFDGNPKHTLKHKRVAWNALDDTLDIHHDGGVIQQVGQETFVMFTNRTGVQIDKGTVVGLEVVGGVPTANLIPYIADGSLPAFNIVGVAAQDVAAGIRGRATTLGIVPDIDTTGTPYGETWADGEFLYASPTITGGFTKVKPMAPEWVIPVAVVLNADATQGRIYVRISPEQSLYYGQFVRITNTTPVAANTAYPIKLNATGDANGISIGIPTSRLDVVNSGLYRISMSFQLTSSSASAKIIWFWLRVNGTDVSHSAIKVTLSSNSEIRAVSRSIIYPFAAGDYFEIVWAADSTNVSLTADAATAFAPSSPAVVVSVQQSQQ